MTTVMIVSDTHGNLGFFKKALAFAKKENITQVIHLGDDYIDCDTMFGLGFEIIRIPGTWSSYYQDPMIDNRVFITLEGWRFFLTHTPETHFNDLPGDSDPQTVIQNKEADFVCHGHTHHPGIRESHGVQIINPGHLKASYDRGFEPSFGVMTVSKEKVVFSIRHLLSGDVYKKQEFTKG
jgi:putative phosphoesterase